MALDQSHQKTAYDVFRFPSIYRLEYLIALGIVDVLIWAAVAVTHR